MILHTEHPVFLTGHAFYRVIQQIQMRYFQPGICKAVFIDCIGVVLGSNLYPAGPQIFYRMISSPVSKLQLINPGSVRKRNDLMAKADSKYWISAF